MKSGTPHIAKQVKWTLCHARYSPNPGFVSSFFFFFLKKPHTRARTTQSDQINRPDRTKHGHWSQCESRQATIQSPVRLTL